MSFKNLTSTLIIFQISCLSMAQQNKINAPVSNNNKLASLSVNIEQNNELFKVFPTPNEAKNNNKNTIYIEIPKKLSYISLCSKKENITEKDCVVLNKLKFSNKESSFAYDIEGYDSTGKKIKVKQPTKLSVQIANLPENYKSSETFDIKQLILEGLKKGMSAESIYLRITPVELVGMKRFKQDNGFLSLGFNSKTVAQSDDSNTTSSKIDLEYKSIIDRTKYIDLFATPIHQVVNVSDELNVKLAFTGFDLKYQLFNPPLMSFQTKIRQQLFDTDDNTLQSYLAFTVAFNLTRLHPGWASVSELLALEKEKQIRQDFSRNANIISLKEDPIYQNVLKEKRKDLVAKYIIQSAELKSEIADYERTNNLSNSTDVSKVAMDQNINIPSSRTVYGNGQLSYQEKLARYMYYSKMTNDTLNIIGGAASAGQSWLDSYLR